MHKHWSMKVEIPHLYDTFEAVTWEDLNKEDVVFIDNYEHGRFPNAKPRISGPYSVTSVTHRYLELTWAQSEWQRTTGHRTRFCFVPNNLLMKMPDGNCSKFVEGECMTTLYYRDGSSDKVYTAELVETQDGFNVQFAYGRRGSSLTVGTKNSSPLPKAEAEKMLQKLLGEKISKGYKPGADGTAMTSTILVKDINVSVLPMLLNAVDEDMVGYYLRSDDFVAEEKFDGVRVEIVKDTNGIQGYNRKGQPRELPQCVVDELSSFRGHFTIDGELVGEIYHAFDLICDGSLVDRKHKLYMIFEGTSRDHVREVQTYWYTNAKTTLLRALRDRNAEGIVFKNILGYYVAGRPNSGGNNLKFKFKASATCEVMRVNDKRSVQIGVYDPGMMIVSVGNVTIPQNYEIPKVGDRVEVEYLYAYRGGSLFQPVYKGKREDVGADDIMFLKYKTSDAGGDDEEN